MSLSVCLSEDELAPLQSVFGDDLTIIMGTELGRSKRHPLTVLVELHHELPGGRRVLVPVALNALGDVNSFEAGACTRLAAPECDERAADYTMRKVMAPIFDSVLEGFPAAESDDSPFTLTFTDEANTAVLSTSGALWMLVGAMRDALTADPKLLSGASTVSPAPSSLGMFPSSSGNIAGMNGGSASGSANGGSGGGGLGLNTPIRAATYPSAAAMISAVISPSTPIHFAVRVYKLEHMRRPTEYIKTLHSWFDNAAFNGRSGFLSSFVVGEPSTPRVFVGFLHAFVAAPSSSDAPSSGMITPMGAPLSSSSSTMMGAPSTSFSNAAPSEAGGECPALPEISTLERMWKTVSIDVDAKGRPCQERLCRNVVDGCQWLQEVPPSLERWTALQHAPGKPLPLGAVRHLVLSVPNNGKNVNADFYPTASQGLSSSTAAASSGSSSGEWTREAVEGILLDCIGDMPTQTPSQPSSNPKQQQQQGANSTPSASPSSPPTGMEFINSLVPYAAQQIRSGALWS